MVDPRMQMLGAPERRELSADLGKLPTEVRELGPIPCAEVDGVTVRVIAGEAAGVVSPVETYSGFEPF